MKFLKKFAVGILVAVLGLSLGSLMLPGEWTVSRSIVIEAPGHVILPFVADFKNWPLWSQFDAQELGNVYTYSGAAQGAGAERSWVSKKIGNGSHKILTADPKTGIDSEGLMPDYNLKFRVRMEFEPEGKGTKVTWKEHAVISRNPVQRYMGLLMDAMMGKIFEDSLAKLKALAEAKAAKKAGK